MHRRIVVPLLAGAFFLTFFALWKISLPLFARNQVKVTAQPAGDPAAGVRRPILTLPDPTPLPALPLPYSSVAPKQAVTRVEPTPINVKAVLTRGQKEYSPIFHSGHSELLAANLNEAIPIQLSWPGDNSHKGVFVQAVHGGKIDGTANAKEFVFDKAQQIAFTFTPDAGPGTYEIVLRRGIVEEALSFWVPTGNPTDPPSVKW